MGCNCSNIEILLSMTDIERQCFVDENGTSFLLHTVYNAVLPDSGSVESTYTTLLDGVTDYEPIGDFVPCGEEVIAWSECFVDEGNSGFMFTRVYEKPFGSNEVTAVNVDLDGNEYTIIGDVSKCSQINSDDWSCCLKDYQTDGSFTVFNRLYERDLLTLVVTFDDVDLDGDPYTITGNVEPCEVEEKFFELASYIRDCDLFDLEYKPDNILTTFTEFTIQLQDSDVATRIRREIERSQEVEIEQTKHGLPVDPFTITAVGGDEYSFNPSGLQPLTNSTLIEIDAGSVIVWGDDQEELIETVTGKLFGNCDCVAVKVIEWCNVDGELFLVDIVSPESYDTEDLNEPSLLDENGLLPFGIIGAYVGACPVDEQVLETNSLCCSADLEDSNPEVTAQITAWMDGSSVDDMRNNGVPIAGNEGDLVDEVLDKQNPLTSPSWQEPTTGHASNPPRYTQNGTNGLGGIVFTADDQNILDLDLNPRASGQPYTVFKLYRYDGEPNPPQGGVGLLAVTDTGHNDGGGATAGLNTWQLTPFGVDEFGGDNPMVMRIGLDVNTDTYVINEGFVTDAHNNFFIATNEEAYNGITHLVTVNFDGQNLSAWFDGELRLDIDFDNPLNLAGELFRLGINLFGPPSYADFTELETIVSDVSLPDDSVAKVNAYLICKWGIDPSLAVGGAGGLTLSQTGSFFAQSPFVQIKRVSGVVSYINTITGQEFLDVPVSGLSICASENSCCIASGDFAQTDVFTVNANGTVPAGRHRVTFLNTGTQDATVNGSTLPANSFIEFEAFYDPSSATYFSLPAIPFVATVDSVLLVTTVGN